MTPTPAKGKFPYPHRRKARERFSANERDALYADLRALLLKYRVSPHTLHKHAELAAREMNLPAGTRA